MQPIRRFRVLIAATVLGIAAVAGAATLDSIVLGSSPSGTGQPLCGTGSGTAAFGTAAACGLAALAGAAFTGAITNTSPSLQLNGQYVPILQGASAPVSIQVNTKTLSAGAGSVTFSPAFGGTPICVCTDTTAVAAVKCSATSTTLTIAGTTTDVIAWNCTGNR